MQKEINHYLLHRINNELFLQIAMEMDCPYL